MFSVMSDNCLVIIIPPDSNSPNNGKFATRPLLSRHVCMHTWCNTLRSMAYFMIAYICICAAVGRCCTSDSMYWYTARMIQ